ncbi:hypothetical protein THAOC_21627, partial [Thalassiosira oceanica]
SWDLFRVTPVTPRAVGWANMMSNHPRPTVMLGSAFLGRTKRAAAPLPRVRRTLAAAAPSTESPKASTQAWSGEWRNWPGRHGPGRRLQDNEPALRPGRVRRRPARQRRRRGGERAGATKAAVRGVRNAIEFNSIPGVAEAVPGGGRRCSSASGWGCRRGGDGRRSPE